MIDLNKTWCKATEENFNALIDNDIECIVNGVSWEAIEKSDKYNSDDIFYIVFNCFDWYKRHQISDSSGKQIHLVNGQFRYVEECAEDKGRIGSEFKSSKIEVEKVNPTCPSNYGFEVPDDFECEIFTEKDNQLFGISKVSNNEGWVSNAWDKKTGKCLYDDVCDLFLLEKPWYEDLKNVGKLIINKHGEVRKITDINLTTKKVGTHAQNLYMDAIANWRPATKEEVLSLVVEV